MYVTLLMLVCHMYATWSTELQQNLASCLYDTFTCLFEDDENFVTHIFNLLLLIELTDFLKNVTCFSFAGIFYPYWCGVKVGDHITEYCF